MSPEPRSFPSDFLFGVATAAYQVEGHIENDWSEWERARRTKHVAGAGVDHWNRWAEDYRLAKQIGAQAFRMSLEWARIEPRRGQLDDSALAGYRQRLVAMREAGLQPVVTLHHFTHPAWFHRETPWHRPESIASFRRYARACAEVLHGLDAVVLTFNEPMVLLLGGYVQAVMPPGIADPRLAMAALGNIGRAHVAAREELLTHVGRIPVGTSQNMLAFAPNRRWSPADQVLVALADRAYNHAFLEAMVTGELRIFMPGLFSTRQRIEGARDSLDFVGVNYYTRAHLAFRPRPPFLEFRYRDALHRGLTDIGWEDYPEGFTRTLLSARRYGLPIWVTENGIDDRDGQRRSGFLAEHWAALLQASDAGAKVRGYLYWSLLDSFEWLEGWGPRFGLYHVDFATLERRATPACEYFRRTAETRELQRPESELPESRSRSGSAQGDAGGAAQERGAIGAQPPGESQGDAGGAAQERGAIGAQPSAAR